MAQKIKVSKAGFNVLTETSPDNLIFSSDYDTLKYYTLGSAQMSYNYANYYHSETSGPFGDTVYYHRNVIEITHNLGYIPHFVVYFVDPGSPIPAGASIQLPFVLADFISFATWDAYADSTKLYVKFYAGWQDLNSGSVTWNFKYRIFRNDTTL